MVTCTTRTYHSGSPMKLRLQLRILRVCPALNGSSEIQRFECSNTIEIRNGIIFYFYTKLPHIYREDP